MGFRNMQEKLEKNPLLKIKTDFHTHIPMNATTKVFSARPSNFDMVHLFISYSHVIIKQVFARTEKMSGLIHYLDGHKIKVDHGFFPPTITNYASFLQSFEFTFSTFLLTFIVRKK